jgi:aldehyde dehydrogenase (NAD+)
MAICREASFAPIMAVLPFDDVEEVVRAQRECAFGLGASIFAGDTRRAEAIAARLEVGNVTVNDVIAPTAHPATSFGGRGASGWGVTQGPDGLLAMTVPQAVSVRGWSFRPHYGSANGTDPATADMLRGLLQWSHGRGWRRRWRALWQMLRGVRGTLRKARDER